MSHIPSHFPCWPAQNRSNVRPGTNSVSIGVCTMLSTWTKSLHCYWFLIYVVWASCCPDAWCSSVKAARRSVDEVDKVADCTATAWHISALGHGPDI